MTDWMIVVPPDSLVFAGTSGFCGSLDPPVTIPWPPALLPLVLLLEPESLLLEHAVSKRAAAAAAARPRPTRVDTVMLRLLKLPGSPEPCWVRRWCARFGSAHGGVPVDRFESAPADRRNHGHRAHDLRLAFAEQPGAPRPRACSIRADHRHAQGERPQTSFICDLNVLVTCQTGTCTSDDPVSGGLSGRSGRGSKGFQGTSRP